MPVADFKTYKQMLENAFTNQFAYPAINVSSMTTANAALKAFANMKCDGMLQVSTGAGKFASGLAVGDMVLGAVSIQTGDFECTLGRPGVSVSER